MSTSKGITIGRAGLVLSALAWLCLGLLAGLG
jgi:hypothetical protein